MNKRGKKITVGIHVGKEVMKTTKELSFNISKLCENCLKEAIRRLQTLSNQIMTNGGLVDARSVSRSVLKWTGRDLNPRPPECKSGVHAKLNYRPAWNHVLFD